MSRWSRVCLADSRTCKCRCRVVCRSRTDRRTCRRSVESPCRTRVSPPAHSSLPRIPVTVCIGYLNARTRALVRCASGCVVECRTCSREVAGSNLGRGYFAHYSAFHPSWVDKWVPAVAGKAKAGMAHSACGWNAGCAGITVIGLSPDNTCYIWAP